MDLSACHARARKTLLALLLATVGALGLTSAFAARADAACTNGLPIDVVAPSCFQAKNGKLTPDNPAPLGGTGTRIDWSNALFAQTPLADDQTATNDSKFIAGKDQEPEDWRVSSVDGLVATGKADIVQGVLSRQTVAVGGSPHLFLQLAFLNREDSGNQITNIEFNQNDTLWDNDGSSATPPVPQRTAGDIMVTFSGQLANAAIGMCRWVGSRRGQDEDPSFGWYRLDGTGPMNGSQTCTDVVATGSALGSTNGTAVLPMSNGGAIPSFPASIAPATFGELEIDLNDALAVSASAGPCVNIGSFWMHSRTSHAWNNTKVDYMAPVAVPGLGTCAIDVEKQVSVDDGDTWHDADTAGTAPITDASNDLDYRIEVENTGTESVTVDDSDISDPNCTGLAPTAPVVIASGQTAVWTCTKAPGSFTAGGSYTNTATVSASVGSYDIPDVSDVAIAGFRAQPTVSTQASSSVAVGGVASDTATINGGIAPGGTVTFRLYGPNDATCSGTPFWTSPARTVTVGGASSGSSPAITQAGTYRWIASYSGDANNEPAAGACNDPNESVVITKADADISTLASLSGGTVAGATSSDSITVDGFGATGTVDFALYGPDDEDCTGDPVFTANDVALSGEQAVSGASGPLGAGKYRWVAHYDGDANNEAETHPCNSDNEDVTVGKADPSLSTNASNTITLGGSIHDVATLSGGVSPGGTITFRLYGPGDGDCSEAAIFTSVKNVSGNGNVTSASFTPTTKGRYHWTAEYSGDADNDDERHACGAANEDVLVQAASYDIVKDGPAAAHPGDEVTFTYEVSNTGDPANEADMALHAVEVSDDKCSPVSKVSGAGPTLDPGETWRYECTMEMPEGQSHTNTATLKADDPRADPLGEDTDTHTVDLLHPSVEVTKTGPESAPAGSAVPFTITIENTGDVAFDDETVTMADPKCSQAPARQGKAEQGGGEDASPSTLDPGDVWTYTCSVQTGSGDTTLENTATGGGTDPLGKQVGDSGSATTRLVPPPVQSAQSRNPTGTAEFVRQPKKQCISKRFRYDVAGRDIRKVTFSIDGKVERVMTKADARGRWSLHVNPLLRGNKRHRLTVKVEFTDASNTAAKTLSVFYKRCTCLSRRAFPIRLRKQFGEDLKSARVYVNGKRVQTIRSAKRLKAPVRLVGLPKGRFTVKITAVTVSDRKVSGTRRYRTCAKKLKGGIPKL